MPLPELLVGAAGTHFSDDGDVTAPELQASIVELVRALDRWARRLRIRGEAP